ncbi:MAG: ribonuclease HII, partial [Deltaproteobacteria bacterium]
RLCTRRLELERAEARRMAGLFRRERQLARAGARLVAGVDEAGVGPLAGPIVAAAVVLPGRVSLAGLDDSKRVDPRRRARLDAEIRRQALAFAVAELAAAEVDALNVYRAGLEAMRRAVEGLPLRPDHVLVDARTIPGICAPQTAILGGDASEACIAAASILAKEHRDRVMRRHHAEYPEYGFARHKGYGTAAHREALRRYGPCPIHRRSFAPVAQTRLF